MYFVFIENEHGEEECVCRAFGETVTVARLEELYPDGIVIGW